MKRIANTDIWFDGLHYWQGKPPNLTGPYTNSDLHDQAQQQNLTGEDSTIIQLDSTTIYPVK